MKALFNSTNILFGTLLNRVVLIVSCVYVFIHVESVYALENVKFGAVMARSLALDPTTQQPILVEYAVDGRERKKVSIPDEYREHINSLVVMSAAEYRGHQQRLNEYRGVYANDRGQGAELLSREEFIALSLESVDSAMDFSLPSLATSIKSVYLRNPNDRKRQSLAERVLLSFPVNLAQGDIVGPRDQSLVLDKNGNIIASSVHTIGYRMGVLNNANSLSAQEQVQGDTIFGPVPRVRLDIQGEFPGGASASDERGHYSMHYFMPLCPVNGYSWQTDVWLELNYQQFLPTGSPSFPHYERLPTWDNCFASLVKPHPLAPPIYKPSVNSAPVQRKDIYVDVMFLTGNITLQNRYNEKVDVSSQTRYEKVDQGANSIFETHYDFNGDGSGDKLVVGKLMSGKTGDSNNSGFVNTPIQQAELQALYFNAPLDSGRAPDLVRKLDTQPRAFGGVGVLKKISETDFQSTDLLVFRASTGELLMERQGLSAKEIKQNRQMEYGPLKDVFTYRLMLQSPKDYSQDTNGSQRNHSYTAWVTDYQLLAPEKKRDTHQLKPGEGLTVVAINRATGFIASVDVQLNNTDKNSGSLLNVVVPDMTLRPPNLKIWAQRQVPEKPWQAFLRPRAAVSVNRESAPVEKTTVNIYTEWLRHDGLEFPKHLGLDGGEQYGLSARLAKIVASDTLLDANSGSDVIEFAIAPGRQIQAVKVQSNLSKPEHYYVDVIGKAKDQPCMPTLSCPSFDKVGKSDDQTRLRTPFLVPLFDEYEHWLSLDVYQDLKGGYKPVVDNAMGAVKSLPAYAWHYQAQYQFSQFELEIQNNSSSEHLAVASDSLSAQIRPSTMLAASKDELLHAMRSLVSTHTDDKNAKNKQETINARQLVFALGKNEISARVDGENQISVDNLVGIDSLVAQDYLTMRLSANKDTANLLKDYAFSLTNKVKNAGASPIENADPSASLSNVNKNRETIPETAERLLDDVVVKPSVNTVFPTAR